MPYAYPIAKFSSVRILIVARAPSSPWPDKINFTYNNYYLELMEEPCKPHEDFCHLRCLYAFGTSLYTFMWTPEDQ